MLFVPTGLHPMASRGAGAHFTRSIISSNCPTKTLNAARLLQASCRLELRSAEAFILPGADQSIPTNMTGCQESASCPFASGSCSGLLMLQEVDLLRNTICLDVAGQYQAISFAGCQGLARHPFASA